MYVFWGGMMFVNEWPSNKVSEARTIDRERDAVLICEGGIGASPEDRFVLTLKNRFIRFIGAPKAVQEEDGSESLTWQIYAVTVPKKYKKEWEEIRLLIREAMEAHGYYYRTRNLGKITVHVAPNASFY